MSPKVVLNRLSYVYQAGTPFAHRTLHDLSGVIPGGSFTMVVGPTGSGKSTLLQHFDALLLPTSGSVEIGRVTLTAGVSERVIRLIRQQVGLVFQVPSDQLFGDTVKDDLEFGPRNFNFSSRQILRTVQRSVRLMHLPPEILAKSPFDLSGGQMKKVTIAGVLACRPRILLLDEPTVGLDEVSAARLMALLERLRLRHRLTVIMVTHDMDWVAKYATQVLVLSHGKLLANTTASRLFQDRRLMLKAGLIPPFTVRFTHQLACRGVSLGCLPLDRDELAIAIIRKLKAQKR